MLPVAIAPVLEHIGDVYAVSYTHLEDKLFCRNRRIGCAYLNESVKSLISICGLMRSYNILYTCLLYTSTETGVEQMAKDAALGLWFDTDIKSSVAGQFNPLFKSFTQSDKMNINCEIRCV